MAAILSNISIVIVKGQNNCNPKFVVQMSDWSQMIELDTLIDSESAPLLLYIGRSLNWSSMIVKLRGRVCTSSPKPDFLEYYTANISVQ